MTVKHITEIASALMLARWKQTLVAATGVTFSITLFIALLGFMEGLNRLLDGLVTNRTAHIRLYNDTRPSRFQPVQLSPAYRGYHHFISSVKPANARKEIYNAEKIIADLQQDPKVLGISPRIQAQVFYNLGNIDLNGTINGVDVEREAALFFFSDYVVDGQYADLQKVPNSIILGMGAAETMLAKRGDVIAVTTTTGEQFSLKVAGFFQSGLADLDKVQSFCSLATTQKLLGKPGSYITDIQVKLKNIDDAPPLAQQYEQLYRLNAEDIQTANAQYETGSGVRSIISYAVGVTLLIVSGFGIYNILNMLIYEKMDTIAILKATGYAGKDVQRIFLTISMSIGVAGALAGMLFGLLLSMAIDAIPFITKALPTVTTYPIDYSLKYYAIAVVFALATTWFAGWLPSRKASRIDPVDIIRGK